jgi:hypothetical protein
MAKIGRFWTFFEPDMSHSTVLFQSQKIPKNHLHTGVFPTTQMCVDQLLEFIEKQQSEKYTHTEKVRNTTGGCRLWDVKNSAYKNSSPTEVKRFFIHQNLSIFITKSL